MRLVVVANRLPVEIAEQKKKNGSLEYLISPGGVVSGLRDLSKTDIIWLGWPGRLIAQKDQSQVKKELLKKYHSYPVFLSKKQIDEYYLGFANKTIWPLFHYFADKSFYRQEFWQTYSTVNRLFLKELLKIIKADDLVFIQDYHLMLLPRLLREKFPKLPIGFFLHIPYPSYEILRILPEEVRKELVSGILGADIVGFHTNDYTQHFLENVDKTLGIKAVSKTINLGTRRIFLENMPLGVNFSKFEQLSKNKTIQKKALELKQLFRGKKLLFSVDRLDYSKGISNRLLGFEKFLQDNPKFHKKVTLILNAQPSRVEIEDYQAMKDEIEKLIGRINGEFGDVYWTPIVYQYTSLDVEQMVIRYLVSDVALVTPLRDGMNLVSKEFVASKGEGLGVLILSETAGSAKELTQALLINPSDINQIAKAIESALSLKKSEQIKRMKQMHSIVSHFTSERWINEWIDKLIEISESNKKRLSVDILEERNYKKMIKDYKQAERRLIILDYDGTIVPYAQIYTDAAPSRKVLNTLKKLADDFRNELVVLSGRDKNSLGKWIKSSKIALVAEHGIWTKERNQYYFQPVKNLAVDWIPGLMDLFKRYTERIPHSLVEEKDYSLAFHYRLSDSEIVSQQLPSLIDEIELAIQNLDLEILDGEKVLEVKHKSVSKGSSARSWISKKKYDFYLAVGDDITDESLFQILPEKAYSIKIGSEESYAKYRISDINKVLKLLEELG